MKKIPRISESEWEVVGVLWKKGGLTSNEVFEMLREREWKLSTVRTFLARLEKKGVVEGRDAGGVKRYSPIFGREDCVRDASASFLDRVFEGAAGQLLMHFAKSKRLSARELDELEAILVQKRRGK